MRVWLLTLIILSGCSSQWNEPRCKLAVQAMPLPPSHPNLETAPKWSSFDRTLFPYRKWLAPGAKPKALVIIVGGWDSTTLDYVTLGRHLSENGYHAYALELRFGRYDPNVRRRGNPKNGKEWMDDLRAFTSFVVEKHPDTPLFYYGHSFGSLVALTAAADADWGPKIKGVIIESPALPMLLKKRDLFKVALLVPFQNIRIPHLRMGPGYTKAPTGNEKLNCAWFCSEDRLREGYKIRYLTTAALMGSHIRGLCGKIRVPILALAGEKDEVVAPNSRSKEEYRKYLAEELCAGKADVIKYEHGHHAMIIPKTGDAQADRTSSKALRDVTHWLDRKVLTAAAVSTNTSVTATQKANAE